MDTHKLIDIFISLQNYSGKGRGVLSWITEPAKYATLLGGLAYSDWLKENVWAILLFGLLYFTIPIAIGWWWDTRRYYNREAEWSNQRNDFVQEMRERMTLDKK